MLVLTRKPGQSLMIRLDEGVGEISAAELFGGGPIEVVVTEVRGGYVKLGIRADQRLVIIRQELGDGWCGPRLREVDEQS